MIEMCYLSNEMGIKQIDPKRNVERTIQAPSGDVVYKVHLYKRRKVIIMHLFHLQKSPNSMQFNRSLLRTRELVL